MKEMNVQVIVGDFGEGDMNNLKRFLYTNSGTREDSFKLLSMTQVSENTLDLDIATSSFDVFHEYAMENKSSLCAKVIDESGEFILLF